MAVSAVLLDTNVWLDLFDGGRPHSTESAELAGVCMRSGISLTYAAISIKDIYYLIASRLKREARAEGELSHGSARAAEMYASSCVRTMDEIACAVGLDLSDVWMAQKYQRVHSDFEDCLILAAAKRSQCDFLITSDEELLKHAPVAALSIADALRLLSGGDDDSA